MNEEEWEEGQTLSLHCKRHLQSEKDTSKSSCYTKGLCSTQKDSQKVVYTYHSWEYAAQKSSVISKIKQLIIIM